MTDLESRKGSALERARKAWGEAATHNPGKLSPKELDECRSVASEILKAHLAAPSANFSQERHNARVALVIKLTPEEILPFFMKEKIASLEHEGQIDLLLAFAAALHEQGQLPKED